MLAADLAAADALTWPSGESEAQRKRPIGMDELTVTARNRDGRLQEIPLAVSAIGGTELKDLDVRRLRDVEGLAPNLAVDESPQSARVHVRGVGSGQVASGDPGVGIYLDGVYLARPQAGLFTLSDIERVEVLRGPQGTLFGRNTIGGAINVVTLKPSLDGFRGSAELRVGNYHRFDTRLSLNLPLRAERAAARVSLATATRDGFQNDRAGSDLDDEKLLAVRTQLLAAPSDDVELVLSLDAARENRRPAAYRCRRASRSAALGACAEDGEARRPSAELSFEREHVQSYGAGLTANVALGESLALRSISAWRRQALDVGSPDTPRSPRALLAEPGDQEQGQLSQELQISGRALDGRLRYVAGLFWLAESTRDEALASGGLELDSQSRAAYGQGTYDLTERLSVTLGARLGAERKRIESSRGELEPELRSGTARRSKDISPAATLKYELTGSAHVYASWSRGFKSGGFTGVANPPALVDDEELTSCEIGFKSLFLDNRIRLNGALFHGVHHDVQLGLAPGSRASGTLAASAARAEINGAELELRTVPHPALELSTTLGVTDGRYTELDGPAQRVGTPTYTLGFGAGYRLPLGSLGDLRLRSGWTHIGRSGGDAADPRILRPSKHGELDAQLAWMLGDGLTEIVLFGKNLLDREHALQGIDAGDSALFLYNPPRTYGLEIRRSFQ